MIDTPITSMTELPRRKKKATGMQRKQTAFVAVTLTPIMILFCVFSFIPIVASCLLAFSDYDPLRNSIQFTGLENMTNLLDDHLFFQSLWNTFRFVIIAMPLNIVITLLIATAIHHIKNTKLRNAMRTLFFLPAIAPIVGSALVWGTLYDFNNGLFNIVMRTFGVSPLHWLADPGTSLLSIILMTLWADIGYNIVLFMAGLDSVPEMFYEAAKLDGAGRFRMFWNITIPLLSRTTLFVTVMTMLSYFQLFTQFKVMTDGGPQNTTRVLSLQIYDTAFKYFDMGNASIMAMILLMIMLLLTLIQLKAGKQRWEY